MSVLSENALQALYRNHRSELEAMIFGRLRCRETAADICQEAFVRLCRSEQSGSVDNVKAYLFRIAMNLLYDHYRSQAVRLTYSTDCPYEETPELKDSRSAEQAVLGMEQLDRAMAALTELSPLCQRIFFLNRFEGLKHREIAEQLNVSIRTVEDNVRRALLHCIKALEE